MVDEKEGEGEMKDNPLTEMFDRPAEWKLDRKRCPWLSDKEVKFLESMPFDYGNIMAAVSYFLTKEQVAERLLTTEEELDKYCQTLWNRSWNSVYTVLLKAAKEAGIDTFKWFANKGNATALSIMAHSIMKLDREDNDKSLKVTIVNDLPDIGSKK